MSVILNFEREGWGRKESGLFEFDHCSVFNESFKGESLDLVTRFFDFIINIRSDLSKLNDELFPIIFSWGSVF